MIYFCNNKLFLVYKFTCCV